MGKTVNVLTAYSHLVTVASMAKFRAREDAPGQQVALLWPDDRRGPWLVRVMWAPVEGRPECVGIEMRSYRETGEEWPPELPHWSDHPEVLTTTALRELPFATIVGDLRREVAEGDAEFYGWLAGQPEYRSPADQESLRRLRSAAAQPRRAAGRYTEVAEVYQHAWQKGRPPTQAVAEHFTISQSAAAKRVSRARQAGYLPLTTRGRPGIAEPQEASGPAEGEAG